MFRMVREGLRAKADVYHSHDLNTLLIGWVVSRLCRTPLVYDSHEIETGRERQKLQSWAAFLERRLIHRVDRVICTNQSRAEYTRDRYSIPMPTILRNLPAYAEPEPSSILHSRLGLPAGEKIVLYQGGIQAGRGLEQLIDAVPLMRGGTILLLGSGKLKPALLDRVASRGLSERIRFHNAVPVGELPQWTACAYVGLQILQDTCPNHHTSLSNKLLEYMMAAVPVIASDLPEMRRVVEDTGAGILVDASSPAAIAEAVNRLLEDGSLRAEMAQRARAARSRYSWEREERVLLELYEGLRGAHSNAGAHQ